VGVHHQADETQRHPIRFFIKGEQTYRLLGVEEPG